jgi:predicted aconitase
MIQLGVPILQWGAVNELTKYLNVTKTRRSESFLFQTRNILTQYQRHGVCRQLEAPPLMGLTTACVVLPAVHFYWSYFCC